jgi:hypothetical protein
VSPPPSPFGQPRAASRALPVEEFLQSLTAQLDRAQDTLAVKVRGTGRPLTWALKDLTIDLRVFVEVDAQGRVLMRSAGPNEEGASTIHLNLTTITRPMVEENTYAFQEDVDPRSLDAIRASAKLDEADARKLEWMGIRTVGQLKRAASSDARAVEAVGGFPMEKLRAALAAAAHPTITGHDVVRDPRGNPLLRIQGANLADDFGTEVKLSGDPVEVVEASPSELLVRPLEHHSEGQIEVFVSGTRVPGYYRLPQRVRAQTTKEAAE